uniref:tRNA-splicing endonuclease subunit Sen54-like isoform X2 n=1 Tax=Erigeron canadensis TaxID=72917 RepID=UPI001CB8BF70|nr:tRNA-splicing endonuclease subunit Sen54-like isoform X2 [Erigeron canadensis]
METEDWSGGWSDLEVASPLSDKGYDLGDSPKLQHRKNVTRAYWKEALGMAEIVSIKGPRWRTTGIVRDGKIYAFLEDVLFLAEIGALHLLDDKDECIPLKDIYMKVAQGIGGLSWESFEVYKHLKSLGYIVKRHGVYWTVKHAKRAPASVEGESGSQRIIDNGSEDISSITEITELFRAVKIKDEVRPVFDVYPPNSMFKKSSPGDPMFILCINHGNPSTKEQIEDLERQCEGIPLLFCYVEHGRDHTMESWKQKLNNPIVKSICCISILYMKILD